MSVLNFPIQNTDRQKNANKDEWHVAMPTSSQFTNGSSLNTNTQALPVGEDENDIYLTHRHLKEDWGPTLQDKPIWRILHGFSSFIKRR